MNVAMVQDIELLRKVALLQEQELDRLLRLVQEQGKELARLKGPDPETAQLRLLEIEKELNRLQGKKGKSERRRRRDEEKREKKPKTGHGPTDQPDLEVQESLFDLDEADKLCTVCGGSLEEWDDQFEESELIDVIERRYVIHKVKRKKYRCQCGSCVETAPGPAKLLDGGRYSLDFAIAVALDKYLDHTPLERQVRQMGRRGLVCTSQTLWDQPWALNRLLRPTYEALLPHILSQEVLGLDQTGWPRLDGKGSDWQMWCLTCEDAVYHTMRDHKDTVTALELLGDFQGIMVCDAMATHEAAARAGPGFSLAGCWVHARRKFIECEADYPEASEILDVIGEMYEVEGRAKDEEDRRRLRATETKELVEKLKTLIFRIHMPKATGLGKAVRYAMNNWPQLMVFLDNPKVWIDNNLTERSIRPPAMGRRVHFGSKSKRGTEVAALFYSLIETAKLCGVDPGTYLREAALAAITTPGTVTLPKRS